MTIEELTVDQIAAARGISRRWAYQILHEQREQEYAAHPASNNQRERVLTLLYKSAGDIRTTNELLVALHADGYSIDGHDVTKTMWSLQKTGDVKFREHQKPRYLFAINLTPEGEQHARAILEQKDEAHIEAALDELVDQGLVEEVTSNFMAVNVDARPADLRITTTNDSGDSQDPDDPSSVAFGSDPVAQALADIYAFIVTGRPEIQAVRERARKANRLAVASTILEEVGEDEMALTLMSRIEFSPLEREIIEVLEALDTPKET